MRFSTDELFNGIRAGNKRLLAKAITLIESKKNEHRQQADELLKKILPYTGNSIRIGITGVPGAGKSTFIESFGLHAIQKKHQVAVLAIDPSSSKNNGSILGDKTRMEALATAENAFIRPSPSSGFLGGVANTTYESMLLCEAAGYDTILIETVGVGQSEILVSEISDVFLFLKITGAGDELQGIKRGIMEMVDIIFINKVHEDNLQKAKQTKQELHRAMQFMPHPIPNYKVPVLLGSALENQGIDKVYEAVEQFIQLKKDTGLFEATRQEQSKKRFEFWVQQYLIMLAKESTKGSALFAEHLQNAIDGKGNPSSEAKKLVDELFR